VPEEVRLQSAQDPDAPHHQPAAVMKRLVIAVAVTALALTGAIPAEAVSQHPKPSQKFGRMIIPKIGLNTPIFEGGKDLFTAAYPASLNRGPAHYRGEPFPWEPGVSMFAGHRTTTLGYRGAFLFHIYSYACCDKIKP
jgi:hypothetical protein